MLVNPLGLEGVFEIVPQRLEDERGFFCETYNRKSLRNTGIDIEFVQDNQSISLEIGTLRGLHFQVSPKAQDKLIRVLQGRIYDVAVDIRRASPTCGRWIGLEISAEKWNQMFVPKGFAHGFVTLEPNTSVSYKVSEYYSQEHDRSIRFDDPHIGVNWPIDVSALTVSEKDAAAPMLVDADLA